VPSGQNDRNRFLFFGLDHDRVLPHDEADGWLLGLFEEVEGTLEDGAPVIVTTDLAGSEGADDGYRFNALGRGKVFDIGSKTHGSTFRSVPVRPGRSLSLSDSSARASRLTLRGTSTTGTHLLGVGNLCGHIVAGHLRCYSGLFRLHGSETNRQYRRAVRAPDGSFHHLFHRLTIYLQNVTRCCSRSVLGPAADARSPQGGIYPFPMSCWQVNLRHFHTTKPEIFHLGVMPKLAGLGFLIDPELVRLFVH